MTCRDAPRLDRSQTSATSGRSPEKWDAPITNWQDLHRSMDTGPHTSSKYTVQFSSDSMTNCVLCEEDETRTRRDTRH